MFKVDYSYLNAHPDLFPSVIGISHSQFEILLGKFSTSLRKAEQQKAWSKERIRDVGGGRKSTLASDFEKLVFILFYYKVYPTFRLAQFIFGFDKRNIQLWVRFLENVLFEAIGYQLNLPVVKARTIHGVFEVCPDLKEILIDATERQIQRPKNKELNEFYYSGKKKIHTVKNQIIVHPRSKRILAVSNTYEGKRHDKRICEEDKLFLKIPPGARALADTAYQGVKHPFLKILTPKKKPPGEKLSPGDKFNNRALSRIRTRVEHPISYLKHFNILSHRFRSRITYAHQPMITISALYNFSRKYP